MKDTKDLPPEFVVACKELFVKIGKKHREKRKAANIAKYGHNDFYTDSFSRDPEEDAEIQAKLAKLKQQYNIADEE